MVEARTPAQWLLEYSREEGQIVWKCVNSGQSKKSSDDASVWEKIEPREFPNRLYLGCKRRENLRMISRLLL